jgi:hypothetical protein
VRDYGLDGQGSIPGKDKRFLSTPMHLDTFPGLKQLECEADYSPPSSAKVKNGELYLDSPIHIHGAVLNYVSTNAILALPFTFIL